VIVSLQSRIFFAERAKGIQNGPRYLESCRSFKRLHQSRSELLF
jgi:hypothetical protein